VLMIFFTFQSRRDITWSIGVNNMSGRSIEIQVLKKFNITRRKKAVYQSRMVSRRGQSKFKISSTHSELIFLLSTKIRESSPLSDRVTRVCTSIPCSPRPHPATTLVPPRFRRGSKFGPNDHPLWSPTNIASGTFWLIHQSTLNRYLFGHSRSNVSQLFW
jgi:hypothetical protein